jgi:pimeloyl-ACP methyl ester carboxylesterase
MKLTTTDGATIRYEDSGGTGYPLLLLAPGGLNSTVEMWSRAAVDPVAAFAGEFRLITMDQRNAGQSSGPLAVDDPWGSFIADQLAVVDHLGIDKFLVMGCCIGCSYALKLIETAPHRVTAAVLEQPIGIVEENRDYWATSRGEWLNNLVESRDDLDAATGELFGARMWDGKDFVVSVTREFVRNCQTPLALLPGVDDVHPPATSREIVGLAPNLVVIDPWKETPELVASATEEVRKFLHAAAEG